MRFANETEFEKALVQLLSERSWKDNILVNPTEEVLINNLRKIINQNNTDSNALNGYPLTDGEMDQIIAAINSCNNPYEANIFLKQGLVSIERDNENDTENYGKTVYLFLFDKNAIGGRSTYQIVRQPKYKISDSIYPDRRGDIELLINGLPLIHIELKDHDVPISKAFYQMKTYANESAFTGIWSLLQIMVAMNPEEAKYFANPGSYDNYHEERMSHWENSENIPYHEWDGFAKSFLSIPEAHQMIGIYSVADSSEKVLKIFRSYQYWAAEKILRTIKEYDWVAGDGRGGYVWHTMSSGKTLTSLRVSELILEKKYADKVCFLTPRNALGSQTYDEYTNQADNEDDIESVVSTDNLISKLKSQDNMIITASLQKMGTIIKRIKDKDKEIVNKKRIVIMVDECHYSVYGDLMLNIKKTFNKAIFIGFTGTPITDLNRNIIAKTSDVFGDELCRYTAGEAMRDENILGFYKEPVYTYKDIDLRKKIALQVCNASSEEEALQDTDKMEVYLDVINNWDMAKIEKRIPTAQYRESEHQDAVVQDIKDRYNRTTLMKRYHSLFATSSIKEAIEYWNKIRVAMPELKVTAVFDSSDTNDDGSIFKLENMREIIKNYNETFDKTFDLTDNGFNRFKKDVADRVRHKANYVGLKKEDYIDMVIVVDQMLEGFDSLFINTLFLDKELDEEHLVQAFSRTIRKEKTEKTQGNIFYYRRPHKMEEEIKRALEIYAGINESEVYVDSLYKNIEKMNSYYVLIKDIFDSENIEDYSTALMQTGNINEFVRLFNKLDKCLMSAKIQGFDWQITTYVKEEGEIEIQFTEDIYNSLLQRYKDIARNRNINPNLPYDLKAYLSSGNSEIVDADYFNDRFVRWHRERNGSDSESLAKAEKELRRTFSQLSEEDQICAEEFLHDIEFGTVIPDENKTFKDYILEYRKNKLSKTIKKFADTFSVSYDDLEELIASKPQTIREADRNGRISKVSRQIDNSNIDRVIGYFLQKEGVEYSKSEAKLRFNKLLYKFVLQGGFDI